MMSDRSEAFESAVGALIAAHTAAEAAPGARARARIDRAFAHLLALAAPRIRYFTRAYGLGDCADDAAQACAIALHRAAERYDPARARFTTYANWQIRAELQALRLRLYGDPRCAGRRGAVTLSYDALVDDGAGDWLADPAAEGATEGGARDALAALCADRLVAEWAQRRGKALARGARGGAAGARAATRLAHERALVRRQLAHVDSLVERLGESDRHIVRRAFADMAQAAAGKPH